MAKLRPWPTTRDLYVLLGLTEGAISLLANGREIADHDVVQRLIEAVRGGATPTYLRDTVQEVLDAYETSPAWGWHGRLPRSSTLLVDRIELAINVPKAKQDEFAWWTREGAFPGRHPGYRHTWRSSTRRGAGHLLRVSHTPRWGHRKTTYANISLVPSILFGAGSAVIDPKVVDAARTRLENLLRLVEKRTVRVDKIDIAIDYDVPISTLQALGRDCRRFKCYPARSRVQTIQSGSRRSPFSLSVYDKRNQLRRVYDVSVDFEWTRFEVRVKPRMRLADLADLGNPFDLVTAYLLEPRRDARVAFKLFVRLARIVGLPRLREVVPDELYDQLLAGTATEPIAWPHHPVHVFVEHWSTVVARLLAALGLR